MPPRTVRSGKSASRKTKKPVPKTKTFAGCWTCRRRKVKCDGARPKCQRCARDYQCEGYDVELFWVGEKDDEPRPSHIKHRAMVVRDDAIPGSCNEDEVWEMLGKLEEVASDGQTARIGPFAIFPVMEENFSPNFEESDVDSSFHKSDPLDHGLASVLEIESPGLSDWDTAEHHSLPSVENGSIAFSYDNDNLYDEDVEMVDRDVESLSLYSQTDSLDFELSSAIYSNTSVGLLMHHYITNIPDLLQPANHYRNPYKLIYVPSAIIGSSNLILGMGAKTELSSSNIAIFHALLSVSAFHLRGTRYTENNTMFEQLGRFHRAQALQNLRIALQNESREMDRHAAMAVMLSLVTSDLMEGGLTEFWIHLEGCNCLRTSTPSDLSLEIQQSQLQTVCLFMTTLAKSTDPDLEMLPWPFDDELEFEPSEFLSLTFNLADSSLEFIYGITATLASFIQIITRLSQHTRYYEFSTASTPPSLMAVCEELGEQIASWSIDQESLLSIDGCTNRFTVSLIQHHILAFHSAILILHHTRLSGSLISESSSILEAYSRATLSNLSAMEDIKASHLGEVGWKTMAPVVWPGFIAACEAAEEDWEVWRHWWTGVQSYRIGSIATMWTMVQDVWAERAEGRKGTSLWVDICRRNGQRIISGG